MKALSLFCSAAQLAVVSSGLIIRGMGAIDWAAPHATHVDGRTMLGTVLVISSMLTYSLVGVGYEHLVNGMPLENPLTQAQVRNKKKYSAND